MRLLKVLLLISLLGTIIFISYKLMESRSSGPGDQYTQELFHQGNYSYQQGDYEGAIDSFSKLAAEKGVSASVLYNLANSYAQKGVAGKAIVNYERALRLSQGDSEIKHNLHLLREEMGLFPKDRNYFERLLNTLTLNQWTALAGLSLLLLTVIQLTKIKLNFSQTGRSWATGICLFLLLGTMANSVLLYGKWQSAVIIVPDARLLISPFETADSLGAIKEGRKVFPRKTHGDFYLVEDETGQRGWLAKKWLELI